MSAYHDITAALLEAGCTQHGRDWTCPSHKGGAEKRPSLSVNEGDKGVVMICHQGCDNDDVLRAIGKKRADMFDEKLTTDKKRIVATYDYTDAGGNLLYQVVRFEPKEFRQRRPNGSGGWEWSVKGVERVPYHLPQLVQAVADGRPVFIVEGEKDVEAIERQGGVATCNSGGAGKWSDEFAVYFKDALVVIVRDKDDVGGKHALDVAKNLLPVVSKYTLAQPLYGKDASDHLQSHSLNEFQLWDGQLVSSSDETPEVPTVRVNPLKARLLKIDEIDDIPPPQFLIQDFIVADSLAVLFGQPGHGKSFVALDWALSIAHGMSRWMGKDVQQGSVMYMVAEGLSGYGIRKKAWRKGHPVYTDGDLHWLRDPVNLLDAQEVADFIELCNEMQPMVVVVDTLARCMPGADENAPGPMSQAIEALDTIRRETKACVLIVHHSPKDGGTPRGHSSLLGAVQTSIKVTLSEGVITLSVEKQKDGSPVDMRLKLSSVEPSAVLEPIGEGAVIVPKSAMSERAVKAGLAAMVVHGGASLPDLMDATGLSRSTIFNVLGVMIAQEKVSKLGSKYLLV